MSKKKEVKYDKPVSKKSLQFDALLNVHKKILADELAKKEHDVEMQTEEGWVAMADENKIKKAEFEIARIEELIKEEETAIWVKRGQDLDFLNMIDGKKDE
jgi:hypothetical protein